MLSSEVARLDVFEVVVFFARAFVSFDGLGGRTEILKTVVVVSSSAKIHGMGI